MNYAKTKETGSKEQGLRVNVNISAVIERMEQ